MPAGVVLYFPSCRVFEKPTWTNLVFNLWYAGLRQLGASCFLFADCTGIWRIQASVDGRLNICCTWWFISGSHAWCTRSRHELRFNWNDLPSSNNVLTFDQLYLKDDKELWLKGKLSILWQSHQNLLASCYGVKVDPFYVVSQLEQVMDKTDFQSSRKVLWEVYNKKCFFWYNFVGE